MDSRSMRHGFESPDNRLIEPTRKAVHFTKNPVATTGLVLFGVLLALLRLRQGSLWMACGWHTGWNWAAGNLF